MLTRFLFECVVRAFDYNLKKSFFAAFSSFRPFSFQYLSSLIILVEFGSASYCFGRWCLAARGLEFELVDFRTSR